MYIYIILYIIFITHILYIYDISIYMYIYIFFIYMIIYRTWREACCGNHHCVHVRQYQPTHIIDDEVIRHRSMHAYIWIYNIRACMHIHHGCKIHTFHTWYMNLHMHAYTTWMHVLTRVLLETPLILIILLDELLNKTAPLRIMSAVV